MNRSDNETLIKNYLKYYEHSKQSKVMRESSLKYFFGSKRFNFSSSIFDITTIKLKEYFVWLKQQDISIGTKKNKWQIIRSFIESLKEDYPEFTVAFPKQNLKWGKENKKPVSNKDVFMTLDEVKRLLDFFKTRNYKYYLVFRLLAETGMRKGGITNAKYPDINTEKRTSIVFEKNNQEFPNVYYFSRNLSIHLEMYLKQRKQIYTECTNLFLTFQAKPYSFKQFNKTLHQACKKLGIEKNITCHTFRRTINNLREKNGCDDLTLKILLNHKISDVNYNSYIEKKYEKFINLYDKWNPYKNLF